MPSQLVTIHDVAKAAGLSKTTVSAALTGNGRLSEATRDLVLREAEKLGYDANPHAQGLRGRRSKEIGFFSPDIDLGVSTLKAQAIGRFLNERGYSVPISAYTNREGGAFTAQEKLIASMRRQKMRAVICNTLNLHGERALAELRAYLEEGGVAVCFDFPLEIECDAVIFDREHNTYLAARHLVENGHREIGLCVPNTLHSRAPRIAGFQRALGEFGVEACEEWIVSVPYNIEAEREGQTLARWFLELPQKPTAMCIVNDIVALTFAALLGREGIRVPEDLSLVGHDNRTLSELGTLPLSSVSHPIEDIALSVVEMLDSRLNGRYDGPPRREIVRGQLFERASVRPI
ncbi:HTH-type transcriptional regulator DegA [Abditibacteriota bacterium]|nr:HTH-type transcriptional regulator DegA [Abditibacteriota bacterium]